MTKSRCTESQIIGVSQKVDAGAKTEYGSHQHGISAHKYCKWKSKYGGMEASDLRCTKGLEEENNQLKRMLADLSLIQELTKQLVIKDLLLMIGTGRSI